MMPRFSRPILAALAITIALLLLAAGHRHQTGHWAVRTPGTSWSLTQEWADSKLDPELEAFTHVPEGLTLYDPPKPYNYMWRNEARLRGIAACMAKGDCHPNALKVGMRGRGR